MIAGKNERIMLRPKNSQEDGVWWEGVVGEVEQEDEGNHSAMIWPKFQSFTSLIIVEQAINFVLLLLFLLLLLLGGFYVLGFLVFSMLYLFGSSLGVLHRYVLKVGG